MIRFNRKVKSASLVPIMLTRDQAKPMSLSGNATCYFSSKIAVGILVVAFLLLGGCKSEEGRMSISGKWSVQLDPEGKGIAASSMPKKTVRLPGSLAENGIGEKVQKADTGRLTPAYKYVGPAYYTREVRIPKSWEGKRLTLLLERVLWESKVYFDGIEKGTQDALGTPHAHELGVLAPGRHTLTIRVDNSMIYHIGDKGHSYTEHTQTLWNGIVGRMEIVAQDDVSIRKVGIYSDFDADAITVKPEISGAPKGAELKFVVSDSKSGKVLITADKLPLESSYRILLKGKLKSWSEFDPNIYKLRTTVVKNRKVIATNETTFGVRKVSYDSSRIYVNNIPTFLRGNIDNVHFPLTGYPSCKVEDWEKIFRKYKDYGLNHVRFHSWCPPEAAFIAADRLGIYIQAETGVWIDWWMPKVTGVGKDPVRDRFIRAELNRIVDTYGNHPSFIMCCIGNELGSADFSILDRWIDTLKQRDPRRLYAASTARAITPHCDYAATHYIDGLGLVRGTIKPSTDWDYENVYGLTKVPIIAHEIGQWPVYPNWDELKKYKGVLKPGNLEKFRLQAQKNGIDWQSRDLQRASGALSQLLYKYEMESFLRTPSCAGIQLLGMYDYPGQGEALIGWLDAFGDSKGITTPEEFRKHSSTTVPLARFKKYVWTNDETLTFKGEVARYDRNDLMAKSVNVRILDDFGKILYSKKLLGVRLVNGEVTSIGSFSFALSSLKEATRLRLKIDIEDAGLENSWSLWVYPKILPDIKESKVVEFSTWSSSVLKALEEGKTVLLNAASLGTKETSVKYDFYPLYWSLTYFPGQDKTNIGLLVDSKNKAFDMFPTDYHNDWQWESVSKGARVFVLNDLPAKFRPFAQPVDDFHRNNKMGILFGIKVGNGKLLVSGFDLNLDNPASKLLKYSLVRYMNSEEFSPDVEVKPEWLTRMFIHPDSSIAGEVPKQFKNAVVYVKASGRIHDGKDVAWSKANDIAQLLQNSDYSVLSATQNGDGWTGKSVSLLIRCPKGILGTFYLKMKDSGAVKSIRFEGRSDIRLKPDGDGILRYHIMREDSQDGILKLEISGLTSVREIAVLKE